MTSCTLRYFGLIAFLVLPAAYSDDDCVVQTDNLLDVTFTGATTGYPVSAQVELLRWERCEDDKDDKDDEDDPRMLVMPGYGHNANTTEAMAIEVLIEEDDVVEVAAINTPGKGNAPFPPVAGSYGNMTQQNLAEIFIQVLGAYAAERDGPVTLFGHSQGALAIMASEQLLMEMGGGLNADFAVVEAAFLAPAVPEVAPWEKQIPWDLDPVIFDLIAQLTFPNDPELGIYLLPLPAPIWQQLFFSTLSGTLDPNVPATSTILDNAYSTAESYLSTLQLVDVPVPGLERVAISKGLFKRGDSGIRLTVMCGKQDTLLPLDTCKAVKKYLGATKLVKLKDGVHDAYITIPEEVVKRLKL